jgi:DNA-binding NtrC family response regulator
MNEKRVLWADDDFPSFPVVDRVLRQCGAGTVDRVITLMEALDLLERNRYDLVIMDAILPQGGDQIGGRERYGGAELFLASRALDLSVIVLTIVPEGELPFAGKERSYQYFHKIELGPRLDEFKGAVAAFLGS